MILFGVAVSLSCGKPSNQETAAQAEQAKKNYLQQIEISGAQMMAASNFLGQQVYTLKAKVTNHGQRTVRSLQVRLNFMNIGEQKVVLNTTVKALKRTGPPLKPREIRAFSVSFDHLPDDWNEGPPQIVPVSVSF